MKKSYFCSQLIIVVMNILKKRDWKFYLIEFVAFTVAFFLIDWLCSGLSLRRSIIGGLVSGVLFTILFWFFDQGHEQIKKASKEDKSEE